MKHLTDDITRMIGLYIYMLIVCFPVLDWVPRMSGTRKRPRMLNVPVTASQAWWRWLVPVESSFLQEIKSPIEPISDLKCAGISVVQGLGSILPPASANVMLYSLPQTSIFSSRMSSVESQGILTQYLELHAR